MENKEQENAGVERRPGFVKRVWGCIKTPFVAYAHDVERQDAIKLEKYKARQQRLKEVELQHGYPPPRPARVLLAFVLGMFGLLALALVCATIVVVTGIVAFQEVWMELMRAEM